MTLNPIYGIVFSVCMLIVSALGAAGAYFTTLFGEAASVKILAGLAILNIVNNAINAVLHMIPSKAGAASEFPLGPSAPSPMITPTVIKVLIAAFALSFLLASSPASAQTRKFVPTGDLVKDIQTTTTDKPKLITGDVEKDAHAIWDKLVAASDKDLDYASQLAGIANTPASMVRKQCYDAILKLNRQVNGMNLLDANGKPIPQPDPKLFTGVEQAAETIDNLSPSGPLFTACAGMAQLTKTNVLTLVNAIVTGAAGFAAMPVIPGL
jgi:hypothetical protein